MGLDSVVVTRQSGDGSIDAHCELVSGGILRVPAGVQVKKWRQPVSRLEMDRFAGALANRYACGVYSTPAGLHPARRYKRRRRSPISRQWTATRWRKSCRCRAGAGGQEVWRGRQVQWTSEVGIFKLVVTLVGSIKGGKGRLSTAA